MAIYMMGVDHKKADLDTRSLFSFTSKKAETLYDAFKSNSDISGCVLIATCNRTELWIHSRKHKELSPARLLCDQMGLSYARYQEYIVERCDREAVDHLFRLAAGLESKIVGEGQILTQTGDAIAFARKCYAADNTLEVLFRLAVTAGKRVRTETDLSIADQSVIRTALECLTETGFQVQGKKSLVIGNGMMGKLAANVLLEEGSEVTITVRRYHSGVVDIPRGVQVIGYEERYNVIPECDLVVSATASPNYTLTKENLEKLSLTHQMPVLDLAVPRDVEPTAAELSWLDLYDIDSFHIDVQNERFKYNLEKAETIIEEEKAEFYSWFQGLDYMPLIRDMKEKTGQDVSLRMTPVLKRLPLQAEEKEILKDQIYGASERMMNHLLFSLKSDMSDEAFREMLDAMQKVMQNYKLKK